MGTKIIEKCPKIAIQHCKMHYISHALFKNSFHCINDSFINIQYKQSYKHIMKAMGKCTSQNYFHATDVNASERRQYVH
jgi:hypothetical protein